MKSILRAVRWIVAVIVAVFAIVGIWYSTSLPPADGKLSVAGLKAPVEIYRDKHWIPHIFAQSEADAYFALGYVHAQDRLWQMEFQRRVGAGRLSEIVGAAAVPTDKTLRTLGLYRAAESALEALSPETRAVLERYAEGVNAWIDGHHGALPLEFAVLRHSPEPWKPADSLVWGKLMALQLGLNSRTEALRARLVRRLGPEKIHEMWPDYPADGPIIVEGSEQAASADKPPPGNEPEIGLAIREGVNWPWPDDVPASASNAWAVSGARTQSGKPLMANDPHLGFSAPILWYLARVETPNGVLAGATVPGVPFFILGHNGRVAWGFTIAQTDQQDLFVERRVDADQDSYQTPDGPRKFEARAEVIRVKNAPETRINVEVSRHGPILYDRPAWSLGDSGGIGEIAVAMSAPSLGPVDRTADSLYLMSRAKSARELGDAMRYLAEPQLNAVFADTDGHIGYLAAGATPVRRSGDGRFAQSGWDDRHDWVGYVPFAELPRLVDPPSGQIVAANNRIAGDGYKHFLGTSWAPPYRARRIIDLLGNQGKFTAAQFAAMQRDNLSLVARDLLPLMLAFEPKNETAKRAAALLKDWDGQMKRDRAEPLIFTAWFRALNAAIYSDELQQEFREFFRLRALFVKSVLNGQTHWCDDVSTQDRQETCPEILEKSLEFALRGLARRYGDDMTAWRWGDAHVSRFDNRILGRVPGLRALANLSIPNDGGDGTVHRGTISVRNEAAPFSHIHGGGFRAVYDLADLSKSRFIIATGQSGNVLSRHYRTLLKTWRDGGHVTMAGGREELAGANASLLTLVPK